MEKILALMAQKAAAGGKKGLILTKAVELFCEKGFYPTKMKEIASAAGIGKGTIYEYFSSKQQLYEEMLFWGTECYFDLLTEQIARGQSTEEKLNRVAQTMGELFSHHSSAYLASLLLSEQSAPKAEMKELIFAARARNVSLLADVFAEASTAGELKAIDARFLAEAFIGMVLSVSGAMFHAPGDGPSGASSFDPLIAARITALFLAGAARIPQSFM